MAKGFKLRICRAITATLQPCLSRNPSDLPENPRPTALYADGGRQREVKWLKEVEPMPRRKICSSPDAEDGPPADQWGGRGRKKNKKKTLKKVKKHNTPSRVHASTSSADSTWYSSDGGSGSGEMTETLVSYFSTDSPISTGRRNRKRRARRRSRNGIPRPAAAEAEIPARLSAFRRLIPCTADGKMKQSFAVVKRSANPYEDFMKSMTDMIVEKQIFDPRDLLQLLECFLALNSRRYHWVIVQAFSEIWKAIFAPASGELIPQGGRRWYWE